MSKCVRILIFKYMGQVIFYLYREALSRAGAKYPILKIVLGAFSEWVCFLSY